jgi:hypothetical protein
MINIKGAPFTEFVRTTLGLQTILKSSNELK